jgi:cation diffusion facilitator CzcD-associated flavoprotein CzcO
VQSIPVLAEQAERLYVFQRTAHFSAPAHNGPMDEQRHAVLAADVPGRRAHLFGTLAGMGGPPDPPRPFSEYTPQERQSRLERAWASDGLAMSSVFADQHRDKPVNDAVSEFMRNKVRATVKDPVLAEKLCAKSYSLGTRRMCKDTGYYETYNRNNVTLVDVCEDPIKRITRTGIQTGTSEYDVDLIIFALGFQAFTGAWNQINIRNARGARLTDTWARGPRTLLGLMAGGFPNLFTATGPGSPSNLANLFLMNEYHMDWIANCIAYMDRNGLGAIEPGDEAMDRWGELTARAASKLLRLRESNYMVQVNTDGTRVFIPYTGGFGKYIELADKIAADNYEGFIFDRRPDYGAARLQPRRASLGEG